MLWREVRGDVKGGSAEKNRIDGGGLGWRHLQEQSPASSGWFMKPFCGSNPGQIRAQHATLSFHLSDGPLPAACIWSGRGEPSSRLSAAGRVALHSCQFIPPCVLPMIPRSSHDIYFSDPTTVSHHSFPPQFATYGTSSSNGPHDGAMPHSFAKFRD